MKQKRVLFLLLLSSLAYTKEEQSKISGEVTFGIDSTFGVDGLENVSRLIPQVIDLFKSNKYKDYEKEKNSEQKNNGNKGNNQNNNNNNSGNGNQPPNKLDAYIPKYNPTVRDLELAAKYLSKNVELRKKLSVKLKENYVGLGLKVDIFGKKITHTKFLGNNEIEKLKLTLTSDNRYINGEINYYVKGESPEKIDIDKIDDEKTLKNKVVEYRFSVNPRPDKNLSLSLDFSGENRNINIGPTIRYRKGGTYVNASLIFNNEKRSYDLTDELDKIKHTAPGYDKIEYFKKWTLKEGYPKDNITKDDYNKEHADLGKAEVSGTKGTARILGHYSGSLYGDSPFRYVAKSFFDEIHSNKSFSSVSSIIKVFEKDEAPTSTSFLSLGLLNLSSQIQNNTEINKLITKIGKKMYRRLGIGLERKYSSINAWTQVPEEFHYLLPGFYKNFDYSKIKSEELDPDYLYNNGIKKPELPSKGNIRNKRDADNNGNGDYKLKEGWHYFDTDFDEYVRKEIFREYSLEKIQKLTNKSTLGLAFDWLLGNQINQVISELPKIQELMKNPYEMKGVDMLRGIYFHQSEKERNVMKYEDILRANFSDVNLKENSTKYSTKIKFNIGHIGRNYKLGASLLLNDNVNVNAEKYGYVRRNDNIGVNATYKEGIIEFDSKLSLDLTKNYLYRKDNKEKHVYNTVSLNTDTYLGLNIPANEKLNVLLGLRHIGVYGWINPIESLDKNGKAIEFDIAKRDESNNPIGKDNNSIITSETTEKNLVDKEYERLKQENNGKSNKLKRDIHQSDYIQTEKSKTLKSRYELYNILSPRVTMVYRPYDNIIFSSHLELPISIRNSSPAGIRGIYTGEIRYLIDDSFKDIIYTKSNPIKFKTSGDIEAGLILGNDVGYYLSYKAMADMSFLRGDIKGNDKDIDFILSLNPLIVNLPIKPRLLIGKEGKEYVSKVGLEYSKGTEFTTILGMRKVLKTSKDILEEELKPNILEILKGRNTKEYERVKEKLDKESFKGELTYTFTPFIDIRKEEGNFRIRAKADSTKVVGKEVKNETVVGEFIERKNVEKYFAWNYQENGWFNKKYNYFMDVKSDKITKETKTTVDLDNDVYNFEIETEYKQDKGVNFDLSLNIVYDEIKLNRMKEIKTITETKSRVIMITSNSNSPTVSETEKNDPKNKVDIDNKDRLGSLKKHIQNKKEKAYDNKVYNEHATNISGREITERELVERLSDKTKIEKKLENTLFLHTKKINANLDTYLGYKFKTSDKMGVSVGMKYNLTAEYISSNKIIVEEIKLFGSRKILFKNTISPEVKMIYNLINNLNARLSAELPINFENKEFKGVKFNVKTGLEYRW
ncbi:hypothetical protein CEP89_03425 [Streptobacillus moniliformis]|uniref:hypothetical protein n=2 Tax=Streptobacillus moniliformis TaxID=34105 RepID=UPI000CFF04F0|nr:hypothetical protein [Streptobacillus moniliformis]AVL42938.1 hypothetical protein CEP89_03425 [Streptobacillus moniliformis]SQA14219.1 Uncharacterised protein [Streptobacillus moniliformis]